MNGKIDFEKGKGLVPAIAQDSRSGEVLMLGYMNEEAFKATTIGGPVVFYSRSREKLWLKGEASGNRLIVKGISLDCDQDAVLLSVEPLGPTCHTGSRSCFGDADSGSLLTLIALEETIQARREASPESSYTASLFQRGVDKIAQKVGEEAVEVVIEAKNSNNERLLNESADLLFHLMVLLASRGLSLRDVCGVLKDREK